MNTYSVSDITALIQTRLESLGSFDVEGEISEIKFHGSGHLYFTLKDSRAQIPCVMWRSQVKTLTFRPDVGDLVLLTGRLSVYPPHGRYQLVAVSLKMAGAGDLYARFEVLKKKLAAEGLFDASRKKTLPAFPLKIALISSETAAGLQDAERIFQHDAPHVKRLLIPARMQGKGTVESVIRALQTALKIPDLELVLIIRGGGSIEDLWEFNSELLAREIAAFPIPVISGIGHETDTTILDYTADYRASTPTNAAETAIRGWKPVMQTLEQADRRLLQAAERVLDGLEIRSGRIMDRYAFRLPDELVRRFLDRLADHIRRLKSAFRQRLDALEIRSGRILDHFVLRMMPDKIRQSGEKLAEIDRRLSAAPGILLSEMESKWKQADAVIRSTHPDEVLKKGYARIRGLDGSPVRSVADAVPGKRIHITVSDGSFQADVANEEI